jgi:hypothetical protein
MPQSGVEGQSSAACWVVLPEVNRLVVVRRLAVLAARVVESASQTTPVPEQVLP